MTGLSLWLFPGVVHRHVPDTAAQVLDAIVLEDKSGVESGNGGLDNELDFQVTFGAEHAVEQVDGRVFRADRGFTAVELLEDDRHRHLTRKPVRLLWLCPEVFWYWRRPAR